MNVATESITCFSDEHHKGLRQKLSAAYYINKKKNAWNGFMEPTPVASICQCIPCKNGASIPWQFLSSW